MHYTHIKSVSLNSEHFYDFCEAFDFEPACIEEKTSDWLNTKDIFQQVVGQRNSVISETLRKLRSEMPDIIRFKRSYKNTVLCVKRDSLKKVCKRANWKLAEHITKTDEWLNINELKMLVKNGDEQLGLLKRLMILYHDIDPNVVDYRVTKKNTNVLCVHRDHIQEFCRACNITYIHDETFYKTNDWLNAKELSRQIPYSEQEIQDTLIRLEDTMPYAIQQKMSGKFSFLCLNKEYLDQFRNILNAADNRKNNSLFQMINTFYANDDSMPTNSDDWITFTELVKEIRNGVAKQYDIQINLLNLLDNGTKTNWVQHPSKSRFLFNKKFLKDFCDLYGYKLRTDSSEPVDQNDPEWLSCTEMQRLLAQNPKNRNKLRKAIEDAAQDQEKHPNWVAQTPSGNYIFNKNFLNEFCKEYGFFVPVNKNGKTKPHHKTFPEGNWINIRELRNLVAKTSKQRKLFRKALSEIIANSAAYSDWIFQVSEYRFMFNKNFLDDFCKAYGLFAPIKISDENGNRYLNLPEGKWISLKKLRNIVAHDVDANSKFTTAMANLVANQDKYSNWLFQISDQRYLFNQQYLKDFCDKYGFVIPVNKKGKNNLDYRNLPEGNWVSFRQLRNMIASTEKLKKQLHDAFANLIANKEQYSNWIIPVSRKKYKFNTKYLKEFCDKYGFRMPVNNSKRKTANPDFAEIPAGDWIMPTQLRALIATTKFAKARFRVCFADLVANQGKHPKWLFQISEQRYLFNTKFLVAFCDEYGFKAPRKFLVKENSRTR